MYKPISEDQKREWEKKIQQQRASGLSIERWCRENQVSSPQFHYWKSQLFPNPIKRSSFADITPHTKDIGVKIECSGFCIQLDKDFDALTLKRCLEVLKEIAC